MSMIEVGALVVGHKELRVTENATYNEWCKGAGSADEVGVRHKIFNASDKDIKYITFTYVPYNPVDDVVACQVSGKTEATAKLVGPFKAHDKSEVVWENLWYNPTISKAVIKQALVQFMDNSEDLISGDEILDMSDKNSEYSKYKQQQKEEAIRKVNEVKDSVVGGLKGLFKKK